MRGWRVAAVLAPVALLACLALSGCGSLSFAWNLTCPSRTECTVVVQSEKSNSDRSTWTVSSTDARVRIVPSHGFINPGQSVTVKVTLPASACDIPLIGESRDASKPFGMGGGSGFAATIPTGSAASSCPPTPTAPPTP
jgi:hypothetical protein